MYLFYTMLIWDLLISIIIFTLYLGLNYISELFRDDYYLLMFWIHFVSINLFAGGWILKDAQKLLLTKFY